MRPRGEVAQALERAAQQSGTVLQFAHRAQVNVPLARYTASRMLSRGELVVVHDGRPAVLVAAGAADAVQGAGAHSDGAKAVALYRALDALERSFWEHE